MGFWREFLEGEVRYVDAGGVITRCAIAGSGESLFFLHGRGGHLETFTKNVRPLSQRFRTVAFDLLGHGLTDFAPDGKYGTRALAKHVIDVIDALDDRPVHIVGQSLGAWLAGWCVLQRQERFASLTMIEPAGLEALADRLSDEQYAERVRRGAAAYSDPTLDAVRMRLTQLVQDATSIDDELIEIRHALYQDPSRRNVHVRVQADEESDALLTVERLSELNLPVLFMRGEHSNTPASLTDPAIAASRARVALIPGARTWPQYENAPEVNRVMLDFLSR
jgi:2-hydroxy-6-oxonona-2,4-dienedioate hydrolase